MVIGTLIPGYAVGCQVDINGGQVDGGAGVAGTWANNASSVTPNANGGASLSLGPEQQQNFYILDQEQPSPFGTDYYNPYNMFSNTDHARVNWKDTTIALNGRAGYAQARAFATASIDTGTVSETVTVWGDPFSLG